jgi:uncharacterized RDD family membrane protein YckC
VGRPRRQRLIDGLIPGLLAGVAVLPVLLLLDSVGLVLSLVVYLAVFGFALWSSGYRQGTTGQSLGRQVMDTKLVSATTGAPIGFGTAFVRQIAHVIDGLPFYLGYFRPLWDARRQTFADSICETVVVRADS